MSRPIRILYIEDDIVTAARVQMQLDQYGYLVDLARDGIEGLTKLKNHPYDIVAVDYHLPGMNGLQILRNLAESQFAIPSIMVTGAGNERVAVEAMKLGVGDYLVKDTDSHYLELLPAVIESELEKQQLITEKQRIKEALHERDTILEAVSFAAEQFLTCAHWVEPIQEVLARLGKAVTASRVYLFENHLHQDGVLLTSQRYEWVAQNITSQMDNPLLHNFSYYPDLKRWADQLAQGLCISGLTQELSGHEAALMHSQDILSFALIPVFVGKKWWGFMGYDDCLKEREWSPVVIETFKTAASLLGAAIQHEQMNKALRESEARLAKTQRIAHLGHCEWDILNNIRRLSEETCMILGLPLDNCLVPNHVFTNAIHREDRKSLKKAVVKTICANKPYDIEFRIIRPNGEIRYVHNLSEVIRDQHGKPIKFIGTLQDITVRKQAETALRETTQTLSAILNAATDSVVMAELDTTCVIINPAGAARLNRTVDQVVGQRLCELLTPEVADKRKIIVDEVIRTKQPMQFEDEEKAHIWFEHSIYPVLDEEGSVTRIAVVSRDISQHKQTENALKKERDFINAIINAAGSLIIVLDRAGNIVRFNRTCEELTGYTFEEIQNRPIWDFFISEENLQACQSDFNQLLTNYSSPLRHENEWLTKHKTRHLIDWSHAVLLNQHNEVEYIIGTGIDITQRKEAQSALARTLAEQKVILDNSLVGIAFLAEGRRFVRVNRKLEEICGYTEAELKGETTELLYFSKADYEKVGRESYPLIGQGATYEGEHLMCCKNGKTFWCRLLVKAVSPNDLSQGYIWNMEDVTEQRDAEQNQRLAATVFETTTEGIIVTNAQNQIIMVNPAFTSITGYSVEEVMGKTPEMLKSGYHDAIFYEEMWQSLVKTGEWQGEIWNRRKQGEIYVEWISIVAIRDSSQNITQYVAVFSDITKRKQTEEFIWHQAHYDALTNLPNRTLFADRLEQALQSALRKKEQLALIFIDLDRFKWVNDTLGHKAGDLLLQEAAQRLTACVRKYDTVARLGGDEFTVILPKIEDFLQVKGIAEKMLENLSLPFQLDNKEASIGGSLGIAFYPEDGEDVETLLKNADIAMYQAKEGGRNGYQFFTPQMNAQLTEQIQLESALRRALSNHEFLLHYQPIIELSSQKTIGIEALLRWQPPIGNQHFPEQFMPLAENTGLIIPIGEWYVTKAVQQLQQWYSAKKVTQCYLAINISAGQLKSSHLIELIMKILTETAVPPHLLVFEISEDILFENLPQAATVLSKLDELGVKIAIDNFGSGWASLQSLRQLPIDIVKIDPFFIHHIKTDDYDMMLTEAIIKLSHKLNIKVIAEGVETQEQLAFLQAHHCDLVQGSYFSNPLKPTALLNQIT
jgi:diguanylate cyclase (GGDEF)-like protein/PAS domain S-box-containing protein